MSVPVIVDDSDASIQYSPIQNTGSKLSSDSDVSSGWSIASKGVVGDFQLTKSGSGKATSTRIFDFTGVSISVFCTIGGPEDGSFVNITVSFSIDGIDVGPPMDIVVPLSTRRHVPVFSAPSLPSLTTNNHTHGVTVLTDTPNQIPVWR